MNIERFDTTNLKMIRSEITEALKPISEKYGITISMGNISYTEAEMKTSLKAIIENENVNGKEVMFKKICFMFGLTENDYGKEFVSNGRTFKVDGLEPKKSKYPIIATCLSDGKRYKFEVMQYKRLSAQ
jgi:hypothetical protein